MKPYSIEAELSITEKTVIDTMSKYGIIAGGFAAHCFNPDKQYDDIDVYVPMEINGVNSFDYIYKFLVKNTPYNARVYIKGPYNSHYQPEFQLYNYTIYFTELPTGQEVNVQLIRSPLHPNPYTALEVVESFDWNVTKAVVPNTHVVYATEDFVKDMADNKISLPKDIQKYSKEDLGWRIYKYVEIKKYNMSFHDILTCFGAIEDKRKFYDQINKEPDNAEIKKFINFVKLMKQNDKEWNDAEF